MPHPALTPDAVAVVTGGASGIGLAAATRFAGLGLRVCIADLGAERLARGGRADRGRGAGRRRRGDGGRRPTSAAPSDLRAAGGGGRASGSAAPTC